MSALVPAPAPQTPALDRLSKSECLSAANVQIVRGRKGE